MNNPNMALRNLITSYSDVIFMKHDSNRSGMLDSREIYPALCELFSMCGLPQPSQPSVYAIMQQFDKDRNGNMDVNEFRNLMLLMNGM